MILLVYGTRPEYIKLKPLIEVFKKNNINYKILFTGQQKDIGKFEYDYTYEIKDDENRLDSIVSSNMNKLSLYDDVKYVIVHGDTTTAMSIALSSFHHNIPVIHIESGLRSYDNNKPFPEEVNRKIISVISSINFCPTKLSYDNIVLESNMNNKVIENTYIVGNTVIDNLIEYKNKIKYDNIILVTIHRRENHSIIKEWFEKINELSKIYSEYEFILPLHPNPNILKYKNILNNVKVINPLNYHDMINLLVKCKLVITDSGGLQEECNFLNKKCLLCRESTERPEVLNISTFIVENPYKLYDVFTEHINNFKLDNESAYGNGDASIKIFNILKNKYNDFR